jgi:hypothetical protein
VQTHWFYTVWPKSNTAPGRQKCAIPSSKASGKIFDESHALISGASADPRTFAEHPSPSHLTFARSATAKLGRSGLRHRHRSTDAIPTRHRFHEGSDIFSAAAIWFAYLRQCSR